MLCCLLPTVTGLLLIFPTAAQLIEGGYEARDSIKFFGMLSPFRGDIEALIRRCTEEVWYAERTSRGCGI